MQFGTLTGRACDWLHFIVANTFLCSHRHSMALCSWYFFSVLIFSFILSSLSQKIFYFSQKRNPTTWKCLLSPKESRKFSLLYRNRQNISFLSWYYYFTAQWHFFPLLLMQPVTNTAIVVKYFVSWNDGTIFFLQIWFMTHWED
jgi:hypothetical protein